MSLPSTGSMLSCHKLMACSLSVMSTAMSTVICQGEAYHTECPQQVFSQSHPICHFEALNVIVAIKMWAQKYKGKLFNLFCDSATAVAIFQASRGRYTFLQSCARKVWLNCDIWDLTLCVAHVNSEEIKSSTDALSQYYKDLLIPLWIGVSNCYKFPLKCSHSLSPSTQFALFQDTI